MDLAGHIAKHNHGGHFDLKLLIGLRHTDTRYMSAHGVFVAATMDDLVVKTCVMFDGAQIVSSTCSMAALEIQLSHLLDRDWTWMAESDISVACHGMGTPGVGQPFWL